MPSDEQVQKVLESLADVRACAECGTAIRFGVYECPHCGADLEDVLTDWARHLLTDLGL